MPERPSERPLKSSRAATIALHTGYWCVVLAFFVLYFGRRPGETGQNVLFAALLLPITILTTYFILYALIPRYLLRRRYGVFALYLFYTLVLSFWLELVLVVGLYMTVSDYQEIVISPNFPSLLDAILGMYLFVSIAVVAHLVQRDLSTSLRLREAELELLKSRIHPHFLFNALNSLYALALERHDDTPELIVRLSTILDYVLYKAERNRVPLEEEIDMLRSYVELERVRCDDRARITFDVDGDPGGREIAPLMMLPPIENAFKHGVHPTGEPSRVDISIDVNEAGVHLRVDNSVPDAVRGTSPAVSGGLGLSDLRRRLDHVYGEAAGLNVRPGGDRYTAELTIRLT